MGESESNERSNAGCQLDGCILRRPAVLLGFILVILGALLLAQQLIRRAEGGEKATAGGEKPAEWRNLFDGKTLAGWKAPNFGGQGEVKVSDGTIVMEMGDSMTGVTYTGKFPKIDYEVTLEAKRLEGNDFFCTTTFPVGDAPCSLVVGGWAGTVVGLSCVDWYDAADNITTQFMSFEDKKWYRVRLRVTKAKIEAWIDKEKIVDLPTKDHRFTIRDECDLCRPFGISTWCTTGAIRNVRVRRIKPQAKDSGPPGDK